MPAWMQQPGDGEPLPRSHVVALRLTWFVALPVLTFVLAVVIDWWLWPVVLPSGGLAALQLLVMRPEHRRQLLGQKT